jgi:serine/threonine protein phosphatase 1
MNWRNPFQRAQPEAIEHRIPDGQRVYAIGDIHGRDDLFADLLARIEADAAGFARDAVTLILLGDYVDRGPASKQVIDRAIALGANWADVRYLYGNHEEVFAGALRGDAQRVAYFAHTRVGGRATMRSYGVSESDFAQWSFEELAIRFPKMVPDAHKRFLARLEDHARIGDYLFAHAGIRPGVPLNGQSPVDMRWIRDDFLPDRRHHGAMIVHGHTISETVDEQHNRIGIDTGAYYSGVLTAIVLEGAERRYLQTGPSTGQAMPV